MIGACDKFIDLGKLLGVYITVAVCTCEPYSSHCNQLIAESIQIFDVLLHSFHIGMDFFKLLGILGLCPLFAALLGLFFASADGTCDWKRDDNSNACCNTA